MSCPVKVERSVVLLAAVKVLWDAALCKPCLKLYDLVLLMNVIATL